MLKDHSCIGIALHHSVRHCTICDGQLVAIRPGHGSLEHLVKDRGADTGRRIPADRAVVTVSDWPVPTPDGVGALDDVRESIDVGVDEPTHPVL
jgi:hypothetical protein